MTTRVITPKLQKAIQALYKDLGWNKAQQIGMNKRVCGASWPQDTRQANAVYCALERMLRGLMTPYWGAFQQLVDALWADRYLLSAWEQGFIADMQRKLSKGKANGDGRGTREPISPKMVKKVREIAHKWGVACGFPNFREMARQQDAQKQQPQKRGFCTPEEGELCQQQK